ncbi:hypothetical protein MGYG_08383 [Nannizzia gypsea CBS 118893]|uniref:Uncharacterized protein n=1 Tax=Arthroderma gypseum (strain ATCC MYA-4604 / CBS 118893) TaxID=535722 RepID=E4V5J7_ARTGP|nr:hypothetical protein MGYG_08383 [Nannizzia gypsea CBS 118893]EFR05372.1 hypothetical protein MGYG_08383 [Nannizzia gypsea CBS 118893]
MQTDSAVTSSGTKRQTSECETDSDDDSDRIVSSRDRKRLRRSTVAPKTHEDRGATSRDRNYEDDVKSEDSDIDFRNYKIPERRFLVLRPAGTACDSESSTTRGTGSDVRKELSDGENQDHWTPAQSEEQVAEDTMILHSDQPVDKDEGMETGLEDVDESGGSEDEEDEEDENSNVLPLEPERASDSNFDPESDAASTDTSKSIPLAQAWRRSPRMRISIPQKRRRSGIADNHYRRRWNSGRPSKEVQQNIVEKLRLHHPTIPRLEMSWKSDSPVAACTRCDCADNPVVGAFIDLNDQEAILEMYLAKRGILTFNNNHQKQRRPRQYRLGQQHRRDLINMFELFFGPFTVEKARKQLTERNR